MILLGVVLGILKGLIILPSIFIGNYIGTNTAGTAAVGNSINGIIIEDYARSNQIGGSAPGGAGRSLSSAPNRMTHTFKYCSIHILV
jgi:hypothetical protein